MRRYGLDALVATSPVNVHYFTGYYWWLDPLSKEYMASPGASSELAPLYAVLPQEGEPALVLNALLAVNAADLWVKDIHVFGGGALDWSAAPAVLAPNLQRFYDLARLRAHRTEFDGRQSRHLAPAPSFNATPLDALIEILRARGLTGARLGVELDGMSAERRAQLRERLPRAELKDCSNLLRLVRAVKSPEEIVRLRRAAEIAERAAGESLAWARPGARLSELVQIFRAAVAREGAEFDHFAYTPKGLGIATEPEYVLEPGDVMYVDFGCIYSRYFSDSGLTLAVGEPSDEVLQRYRALRACMDAGIAAARVGVRGSVVQRAMVEQLEASGGMVSYPHGHALGLEVRDYPILVPANGLRIRDDCVDLDSDLELEENMVFNLEAANFRAGLDSMNIEQSFIVTASGAEPLVPQSRVAPLYFQ